jgi:sugar phosphate isomerase/epimerase
MGTPRSPAHQEAQGVPPGLRLPDASPRYGPFHEDSMRLLLIRSLWGVDLPWEQAFPRFAEEGFHGIECGLPAPAQRGRFRELLDRHGLFFSAMAYTGGSDVAAHLASLREQIEGARELGARLVTSHSGNDAWDLARQRAFFAESVAVERDAGVPVCHETHRGRILFNPRDTLAIIREFPALRLCADFSHWVCVGERLLEDQVDTMREVAERAIHVHARVGYEHGPQVPDPRAPEYQRHLVAHERWWDWIWDSQQRRGCAETTLTPEFGPPDYLHTLPFTRAPVADLAEICVWQARRQAARFAQRGQGTVAAR